MRKYAIIILCAAMLAACSQNGADIKYSASPEPTAAEETEVKVKREPKEINAGDYDGLDNRNVKGCSRRTAIITATGTV